MKKIVKSTTYYDAEYIGTFKRGNREFVKVAFTNRQWNGHTAERDIPMENVIEICRVKTKFEKWIIKLWKKLFTK